MSNAQWKHQRRPISPSRLLRATCYLLPATYYFLLFTCLLISSTPILRPIHRGRVKAEASAQEYHLFHLHNLFAFVRLYNEPCKIYAAGKLRAVEGGSMVSRLFLFIH
jgi:hypothetical protein